jgi:dTDP-4-dehydrorhamnose reductase
MARLSKVLVVGRSGQVAQALVAAAWPSRVRLEARGRESLDLRNQGDVTGAIAGGSWALVINAAAYTQVDRAEDEPDEASAVNCEGPRFLARACAKSRIPLIHLSTDYVFDGRKTRPYDEVDVANPLSVYGASKAHGESAVRSELEDHVIIRTSWVFSAIGHNFVRSMLRLGAERSELRVIHDQRGCPSPAQDIADAIVCVASALLEGKRDGFGIFHFAGSEPTTWYGFAKEIFRQASTRGYAPIPRLTPIAAAQFPTRARRPANSILGTTRIRSVYHIAPRPWARGLSETLDVVLGPARAHAAQEGAR